MQQGWARVAPGRWTRMPSLNLLPRELQRRVQPWVTIGLLLAIVGLLLVGYAMFYIRGYGELEVRALGERRSVAESIARDLGLPVDIRAGTPGGLGLPVGVLEDWAELRSRQIDWGGVLAVIVNALGQQVRLGGINQAGYTLSIWGEAATADEATAYVGRLRDSGFFTSLEMSMVSIETPVVPGRTPSPAPTVLRPSPTIPPPPVVVPPPVFPPPPPPIATSTRPAGTTPTIPPTKTAEPSATATPAFDFVVAERRETVRNEIATVAYIRVRVVDTAGNLVPGVRLRIASEGSPSWGDTHPHPEFAASDGTFSIPVGMGKFTIYLLNGSSEAATGLFTGVTGQAPVRDWDVTLRKMTPGTPLPEPAVCSGCPTPTLTLTPAPTATPVAPGVNLASRACITGSHSTGEVARVADGDVGSAWDSGQGPIVQITFDFTRFPNGHARACQARDDGSATVVDVEAFELLTHMSARARGTHEIWTLYDTGSGQLEHTFTDVEAVDGQVISARFAGTRKIKAMLIRTIRSGVNVGWREIRIFEPLAPGFPVPTATPTNTQLPTATPTIPSAPRASITSSQASSAQTGHPASAVHDDNPATYWRPEPNTSNQYLEVTFPPQTVAYVRFTSAIGGEGTSTPTVGPSTPTPIVPGGSYRVVLLRPGNLRAAEREIADTQQCGTRFVVTDFAEVQLECSVTVTGVTGVQIYIDSPAVAAIPPGIREILVLGQAATPTPLSTSTPAATFTPTITLTATRTATPTWTPTAVQIANIAGEVLVSSVATPVSTYAASHAVDAPGTSSGTAQYTGTYWLSGAGASSAHVTIGVGREIRLESVEASFYSLPESTATVTVKYEAIASSGTPIASEVVTSSSALSSITSGITIRRTFGTPVAGTRYVRVNFESIVPAESVGVRTLYIYERVLTGSSLRLDRMLRDPVGVLREMVETGERRLVRVVEAAELQQVAVGTATPMPDRAAPSPTPVLIGAPRQTLPPGSSLGGPVPGPTPVGRVSFLIAAQARPGGP
ncbi:MAG: discoidin domain-containing protein [Chloroflexi bacterium]|nr:discoidin domain-containing protein [Chloroflexota bacterium]